MRDYWVDRRQITGFIGSICIIFGTFLPIYTINLIIIDQVPVPLIDLPLIGRPIAIILIAMGILSLTAIAFEEYTLLYLSGLVCLVTVLTTFILVEAGLVMLSDAMPKVFAVINYLFSYDFGWIFLMAGCGLLLVTPILHD
ncbi:MAG: hypothetical protein MUF37_00080 [Methanoregulaceae archaeon]|nr:hypothetical protein [Methanoregulaceae archaeon]